MARCELSVFARNQELKLLKSDLLFGGMGGVGMEVEGVYCMIGNRSSGKILSDTANVITFKICIPVG